MTYEEMKERYQAMTLPQLAKEMVRLKDAHAACKANLASASAEFDLVRLHVVPDIMSEQEISSLTVKGTGRLTIAADAYCSTKKGMKGELFKWMQENGFEDLITEVINPSSLKAFIKEQVSEGNDIPDDTILAYTPFLRASVTK